MTEAFALTLSPEALEAIAERAAELVAEKIKPLPEWMDREQAAAYMGWKVTRLEKRHDVPHIHDEGRVYYSRRQIDEWLLEKGDGHGDD